MSEPPAAARAANAKLSRAAFAKLLVALIGIGLLMLLAARLPLMHWLALGAVWTHAQGLFGALIGALAIIVITLLMSPLVPLILLSGWLWSWWGLPISLGAATLSAMISFSIARALARTSVAKALRSSPRAEKIFALAERGGPATVALLRVAPIIPFTPGNSLLGLTRLRLSDMAIGTPLGLLPASIFYIWMGSLLPEAEAIERGDVMQRLAERKTTLIILLVAHAAVIAIAALIARKTHADSRAIGSRAPNR